MRYVNLGLRFSIEGRTCVADDTDDFTGKLLVVPNPNFSTNGILSVPNVTGHSFVDDHDPGLIVRIAISEATPRFKWYLHRVEVRRRHGKKIGIACSLRCLGISLPQISTAEIEGISAKRQT